jgi:hypothetical protein
MASSTVSVVLSVTGLGVMQSLTRLWLTLVGVDTNTLETPEKDVTGDGIIISSIVVLPKSKEKIHTEKLFMVVAIGDGMLSKGCCIEVFGTVAGFHP